MGHDMSTSTIKFTVGGGEPGPFALPAMRDALDKAWGAQSCDHMGIAEIDAFGVGDANRDGVLVDEMNVFCWSIDPDTGEEVPDGEIGENIVTSYVNSAQPLINYRTHDLVRRTHDGAGGRTWTKLEGVILGRTDFMITGARHQCLSDRSRQSHRRGRGRLQPLSDGAVEEGPARPDGDRVRSRRIGRQEGRHCAGDETPGTHPHDAEVRLDCKPVTVESLPRYELKTVRIVDNRPKELRRALDR